MREMPGFCMAQNNLCECCGDCCQIMMIKIEGHLGDDWARARGCEIRAGRLIFPFPCPQLDQETKKCKIYEGRPELCKKMPVGGVDCLLCRRYATQK